MASILWKKHWLLLVVGLLLVVAFAATALALPPPLMLRNLLLGALATLAVLVLVFLAQRHYCAQLQQVAAKDPLTGLLNRHAFAFVFEQACAESLRSRSPISVIFADIDHLRSINDTYGRLAGDKVLLEVAALFGKQLRDGDLLARWEGGKFMILLKDSALDAGVRVAEKLAHALVADRIKLEGHRLQVSASFGVVELQEGEVPVNLFARVDSALYAAKASGRNRVVSG